MLSLRQFDFNNAIPNFSPAVLTKGRWRYTKKTTTQLAGVELPGLFDQTVLYPLNMRYFFGILLLEAVPTIWGYTEGVFWPAIIALIITDIILAVISHTWHGKICTLRNQKVNAVGIPLININRQLKKFKFLGNLFYGLILLSAIFKVLMYYKAHYFGNDEVSIDPLIVGVSVCYLMGAILHIQHTGYFIYTSSFNFLIAKDYREFLDAGGTVHMALDVITPINTIAGAGVVVPIQPAIIGQHQIFQDPAGMYFIKTHGILLDEQFHQLIIAQMNAISKGIIVRQGLDHQLLL